MSTTESLSNEFQQFLQSLPDAENLEALESQTPQTDLYSLFTELAALKSEVKCESRLVKSSLDEFSTALKLLREAQQRLQSDNERNQEQLSKQETTLLRPMLLEWLDSRDRLQASVNVLQEATPKNRVARFITASFAPKRKKLTAPLLEGQLISLRKVDDLLLRYDVHPLAVLDTPLNPNTSKVISTVSDENIDSGIVVEVVQQGYTWKGKLLRYAEVNVNKREPQ